MVGLLCHCQYNTFNQNATVCVCKAPAVIKLEIASDKTLNTTIIRVLKLMKPSNVTMDLKQLLMESLSQAKATKPYRQMKSFCSSLVKAISKTINTQLVRIMTQQRHAATTLSLPKADKKTMVVATTDPLAAGVEPLMARKRNRRVDVHLLQAAADAKVAGTKCTKFVRRMHSRLSHLAKSTRTTTAFSRVIADYLASVNTETNGTNRVGIAFDGVHGLAET